MGQLEKETSMTRHIGISVPHRRVEDDDDIQAYVKPWRGLTRDEQSFVYSSLHNATSREDSFWVDFANAIEQALKEKNA